MRVLGGRDDDGVEAVGLVEDASEVVELPGLWEPLGRFVERVLVDVAEDDDVLVRMRRGLRALLRPGTIVSSLMFVLARPPQAMNAMSSLPFRFCRATAPVPRSARRQR